MTQNHYWGKGRQFTLGKVPQRLISIDPCTYLTIIPRARMGSESIARDHQAEGSNNNCFSKIQLVGQKYRE